MGLDKEKTAPMRKKKKKVNAIVNHNYHNPHNSNTKRISLSLLAGWEKWIVTPEV